jgi:hypothetical protein
MTTQSAFATSQAQEENVDAEIGFRVHTLMWERRITQSALGEKVGVGQSGLGRRLRGERKWTPAELRSVAQELGVTVGYLFGEEEPTIPAGPKGPLSDYSSDGSVISMFTRLPLAGSAA